MSEKKSTNSEAMKRARAKHRKKLRSKTAYFNTEIKADVLALAAAETIDNFSKWVKERLLEEAKKKNIQINLNDIQ